MSIARVTVIRLKETPKYLVGEGRDAEVVETLQFIAKKYNRPCSLTLETMQACGVSEVQGRRGSVSGHGKKRFSFGEVGMHIKGLFATRKMGLSTSLIWFSWVSHALHPITPPLFHQLTDPQLLIGLAYPLYNVFLPIYIRTRGAQLGGLSDSEIWRNYALSNLSSIPSPILAGYMCKSKYFWGRRGTMIIGALVTMAFFFAYTEVKSNAQNLGFTCAISFCLVCGSLLILLILIRFLHFPQRFHLRPYPH
jgi:hypothetical protein